MADDQIVDSLRVRAAGASSDQWPQLSVSPANSLWLTDSADPLNTSPNAALQVSLQANAVLLEALATDAVTPRQLQLGNGGDVSLASNGGKVGVGTTTPAEALEVAGAVKATAFLLNNTPIVSSQWASGAGSLSFTGGNVGIGTTSPQARLQVHGGRLRISESDAANGSGVLELANGVSSAAKINYVFTDGSTGHLHLRTDSAAHHVLLQAVGTQGNVGIGTTTPTRPLTIRGRTDWNEWLSFETADGATKWHINRNAIGPGGLNFAESGVADARLFLQEGGNVGIGTRALTSRLHVAGNAGILSLEGTDHAYIQWYPLGLSAGRRAWIGFGGAGTNTLSIVNDSPDRPIRLEGNVWVEGHFGSRSGSSDIRLKTDIAPLTDALEKLQRLRGVTFKWADGEVEAAGPAGAANLGVIAQEVEAVFPELVTRWGSDNYRTVDYGRLTVVLIEAVKELHARLEALTRRIEGEAPRRTVRLGDDHDKPSERGC